MKGDLCSVGQRGFHPSQRCEARQNDEQITLTHRIQYICYVYLLTFTINKSSMQVNVPSSHGSVMGHSQGTSCGDMAPRNLYSGYLSMVVHLQMIKNTVYIYIPRYSTQKSCLLFSVMFLVIYVILSSCILLDVQSDLFPLQCLAKFSSMFGQFPKYHRKFHPIGIHVCYIHATFGRCLW